MKSLRTVAVAALISLAIAGCEIQISGGDDSDPGDAAAKVIPRAAETLETMIQADLPKQIRRASGLTAFVKDVICTDIGQGNRFDCAADVSTAGPNGGLVTDSIGLQGTCDERSCTWRIGP